MVGSGRARAASRSVSAVRRRWQLFRRPLMAPLLRRRLLYCVDRRTQRRTEWLLLKTTTTVNSEEQVRSSAARTIAANGGCGGGPISMRHPGGIGGGGPIGMATVLCWPGVPVTRDIASKPAGVPAAFPYEDAWSSGVPVIGLAPQKHHTRGVPKVLACAIVRRDIAMPPCTIKI